MAVVDSDSHHDVYLRSTNQRHDSTRCLRFGRPAEFPGDNRSSRQNFYDSETVRALDDTKSISDGRIDLHRESREESESHIPLLRNELRTGAKQSSSNDSRHDCLCERGVGVEISSSRRSTFDGGEWSPTEFDHQILETRRHGYADEVSELGYHFNEPPRRDDSNSRQILRANRVSDSGDESTDDVATRMLQEIHTVKIQKANRRLFAKRPTQVALEEHACLPLHIQNPPVKFLSWEVADRIINDAATFADDLTWRTTTITYRDENAAQEIFKNRTAEDDVVTDARISERDLEQMIAARFAFYSGYSVNEFERKYRGNFAYAKIFSVVETKPEGDRRRIIAWPRSMNYAEKEVIRLLENDHYSKVKFSTATEVRDRGVNLRYAASLDFKKFFQQFELGIKKFCAFKFQERVFFLSTIPTGAVFPPIFAQALSRTIVALSVRRARVENYVQHDGCIDNLRLCSDNLDALWEAWRELISLCEEVGATIGEINPPPTRHPTPYTYLGMNFSTVNDINVVELSSKSKSKVFSAFKLIDSGAFVLVVDALAMFGQTVWACTVTGFKLGRLYHVIKFIRRIQTKDMNERIPIWPSIVNEWCTALREIVDRRFSASAPIDETATMYTDASESGWGVVILDFLHQPIRIFAGAWSQEERRQHINHLELRALRIGGRLLREIPRPNQTAVGLNVFVDNTTALSWAKRSRAPNFSANQLALQINDELERANIRLISINYVQSAFNIADEPSRRHEQERVQVNCVRNEFGEDGMNDAQSSR